MRTLAICAAPFYQSVRKAAGVIPILSPPLVMARFNPHILEGYNLIYLKLHGLPNQPYWYGETHESALITAMSADQVRQANLTGTTVFVANCHLYQVNAEGRIHPGAMLTALLAAGARAVVGGAGQNYAKRHYVHGPDRLGLHFRHCLQLGMPPHLAYKAAWMALKAGSALRVDRAIQDALSFQLFHRETKYDRPHPV